MRLQNKARYEKRSGEVCRGAGALQRTQPLGKALGMPRVLRSGKKSEVFKESFLKKEFPRAGVNIVS